MSKFPNRNLSPRSNEWYQYAINSFKCKKGIKGNLFVQANLFFNSDCSSISNILFFYATLFSLAAIKITFSDLNSYKCTNIR